jgi:hypothetical protein
LKEAIQEVSVELLLRHGYQGFRFGMWRTG